MKNPWMSLWLSAANRTAGSARGLWMAEAQRQQKALLKALMQGPRPAASPKKRSSAQRRSKG